MDIASASTVELSFKSLQEAKALCAEHYVSKQPSERKGGRCRPPFFTPAYSACSSVVVSIHAGMHACGPCGEHQQRSRVTVAAR
jgi:hypothetical protein